MSPKSRLYTLVKAWKNKPFQEVRDACGQPWLGLSGEALEEHQSWSQRQAISNEPIFNSQGTKLTSSLFRPLLTATDIQLLRLFMEGLDTITYWYRSGRFIPGILPMPAQHLASSNFIDALSDLILNSRLPVGLVSFGVHKLNEVDSMDSCMEGLLRMRRLGVLIHVLDFCGTSTQVQWIEQMEPEGIHIEMGQFRADGLPNEMISLGQKFHSQIYASSITLVKDLENVIAMGAHHCYGGLMMPSVSRHQMLHISDSRIAKAIFSLHPHKNLNGDK
ncbi:diguanylate phosphodiesterase [Polynucleobacter sp. 80A-SIGWE]|uniref:diguanylate phosphodiesterase n=1 Tax=Polynucleobacter sp. 80A-SIGWE TaxID=2689100 RepID=UPI001C0B7096|nr:diguanylate phosphodiesterase [Polynucleobacter sp. 80A-SIGWE]MBU3588479.1 diguanylate phosphodiesterase [Polynucleobacter sp. 80A-SIGWE]